MKNQNKLVSAIMTLVLGVLMFIYKGGVISIGLTVIGIALVVLAVLDFVHKNIVPGVIKAVFAALILVFGVGNLLVTVGFYVLGALALIYGILQVIAFFRKRGKKTLLYSILALIEPVVCVAIGVCLLFYQGSTVNTVLMISGVLLMVDGVLALLQCATNK